MICICSHITCLCTFAVAGDGGGGGEKGFILCELNERELSVCECVESERVRKSESLEGVRGK